MAFNLSNIRLSSLLEFIGYRFFVLLRLNIYYFCAVLRKENAWIHFGMWPLSQKTQPSWIDIHILLWNCTARAMHASNSKQVNHSNNTSLSINVWFGLICYSTGISYAFVANQPIFSDCFWTHVKYKWQQDNNANWFNNDQNDMASIFSMGKK